MSTARYGREKILPGKVGKNNLPYWVGLQGLTTREVGLGAIDTEGGGRLRTQRVSEACLEPVKERERTGGRKERDRGRRKSSAAVSTD